MERDVTEQQAPEAQVKLPHRSLVERQLKMSLQDAVTNAGQSVQLLARKRKLSSYLHVCVCVCKIWQP